MMQLLHGLRKDLMMTHSPFHGSIDLQDLSQTSSVATYNVAEHSILACSDMWDSPLMSLQGHAEGKETRGRRQGWQAQGWSAEVAGDWGASRQHAGWSPLSALLHMLSSTLSSFIVASAY